MHYNSMELMICCAARELEDGKAVAVGTGVPCAAAMLAQRLHAPNLTIVFEAGGVAPLLPTMPISVGDSRPDASLDPGTLAAWTMLVNELMNLDEVLNK